MHIGMRLLHPAAADHSVSISRQQVQRIFSFSLRSRVVLIVLLQTYPLKVPQDSVLVDGDSAVVVSFVEWIAHIRLHYPLLCCSDHLPCALQHAKRCRDLGLADCTEADWGNPAHPAPACSCCLHPAAGGSASVYSSSRAAPCRGPRSRAADAAASSQAAPWSRPQGSRPARPGPRQTRRQASKQAALRRTTQGCRCLLFGRWWTHHSLPRRRAGRRIFCFFFCHWPHGQWYPKPRQKRSFLYLWVPRGDGGLWTSQTWVTLTLLSRQWAAVGGSRGRSIALLTHPLPERR